ncbi:MAG: NusG domain II-containing protein [Spirochaetaceae bacterium]|nr:NusG domain II-containing protein [Spirochaetaceae bacterium]
MASNKKPSRNVTPASFPWKFPCVHLKILDYLVFYLGLAFFAVSFFFVYGGAGLNGAARLSVSGPYGNWLYPLDSAETVVVPGPLGDTLVRISGGEARVVSSPCRGQTCVAAPPIGRRGQWTACLPNQVVISVGGGASSGTEDAPAVDGLTW